LERFSTRRGSVPSGNEELDSRLGGGIPIPCLLLIEGGHGSGKSVLIQQFVYGALRAGFRVHLVTTEATARTYVLQSKRVSLDVSHYFIRGQLKVFPLHVEGVKWGRRVASRLLPILDRFIRATTDEWDVFAVDSLSPLFLYASTSAVLQFIASLRSVTSRDRVVIASVHPKTVKEDVLSYLRMVSDGYIQLDQGEIGGRLVKVMRVAKLRGALGPVDSVIVFDVDPAFGIKVLPIAVAHA